MSHSLCAAEYYRSNAIGSTVSRLAGETAIDAAEYVLVIDAGADRRTETLYHNGEEARRLLIDSSSAHRKETLWLQGVINTVTNYNQRGQIVIERRYDSSGDLVESLKYTYTLADIIVTATDSENNVLYTETQQRHPNGRIQSIERTYPDETATEARFSFLDRLLLREQHTMGNEQYDIYYDTVGRAIQRRSAVDGETLVEENIRYLHEVETRNPSDAEIVEAVADDQQQATNVNYDRNGNPLKQTVTIDGTLIEIGEFDYNGEQLIQSRIRRTGTTTFRETIFNEDGDEIAERWYVRGQLSRTVIPLDGNERYEQRHINGEPYIRIYFRGQVRLREEFLDNDEIVRTRIYEE